MIIYYKNTLGEHHFIFRKTFHSKNFVQDSDQFQKIPLSQIFKNIKYLLNSTVIVAMPYVAILYIKYKFKLLESTMSSNNKSNSSISQARRKINSKGGPYSYICVLYC